MIGAVAFIFIAETVYGFTTRGSVLGTFVHLRFGASSRYDYIIWNGNHGYRTVTLVLLRSCIVRIMCVDDPETGNAV